MSNPDSSSSSAWVVQQNIERFNRLLQNELDPKRRRMLSELLAAALEVQNSVEPCDDSTPG